MLPSKPYSVKYEDGKTYQGVLHEQMFNKPEGSDRRSVYGYSVGERVWIQIPGVSVRVHATIVQVKRPCNWRQLQRLEDYTTKKERKNLSYRNYWHCGDHDRDFCSLPSNDCPDAVAMEQWLGYCYGRDHD